MRRRHRYRWSRKRPRATARNSETTIAPFRPELSARYPAGRASPGDWSRGLRGWSSRMVDTVQEWMGSAMPTTVHDVRLRPTCDKVRSVSLSQRAFSTTLKPRRRRTAAHSGWGSTQTRSAAGKARRARKENSPTFAPPSTMPSKPSARRCSIVAEYRCATLEKWPVSARGIEYPDPRPEAVRPFGTGDQRPSAVSVIAGCRA